MPRALARVVCWGEVLWDRFPDQHRLGGAPANVAYHLAALGVPVALVTRVGDDEPGHKAIAALESAGVDCRAVQIDDQRPTGAVDISLDAGEPRYRLRRGCAWERIALTATAGELLRAAEVLVFGTLAQRTEDGRCGWEDAVASTSESCIKVCDPNLRPAAIDRKALDRALEVATVVKLNDVEAAAVADALAFADPVPWLLADGGMNLVALTHGDRGCTLVSHNERVAHPGCVASPGGDNVGAGDAFTAVLISGLIAGEPLASIADRGCRYGAHVASHRGATPPPPGWARSRAG